MREIYKKRIVLSLPFSVTKIVIETHSLFDWVANDGEHSSLLKVVEERDGAVPRAMFGVLLCARCALRVCLSGLCVFKLLSLRWLAVHVSRYASSGFLSSYRGVFSA